MSLEIYSLLLIAGLGAGFVDAIAGGGGLISVPALLWAGLPPQIALGTNKLQAVCGTAMAVWKYSKANLVRWSEVRAAALMSLLAASAGTSVVTRISNEFLKLIVPWLLLAVAIYVMLNPNLGKKARRQLLKPRTFACYAGCVIGFYDGFFGPGTGTFWTLACLSLLGLDLTKATAFTKVVNLASNLSSVAVFTMMERVHYPAAAIMIMGQLIGSRLGAGMAVRHGAVFIRRIFLMVVFAMILKLFRDLF
jgi:uncharacterized membrane protein YfcA